MERRHGDKLSKSSPLPGDYLKMVNEVFNTNFDAGLKELSRIKSATARFETAGQVYANEVVLCVTLAHEGEIAATSCYASCDFDPRASSPTVQDLLSVCVDAVGALYGQLFSSESPERLAQLAEQSLSAFENIPFEWTPVEVERFRVYLKMDKSNPKLDDMADEWLRKNDPELRSLEEEEERETEKLFVTGPKSRKPGSGTLH